MGANTMKRKATLIGLAALGAVALALPVGAQNQEAGGAIWEGNGCMACHGAVAQGGEGGEMPAGPNLRRTRLDRDGLIQTISCGRPGTLMPAFLEGAYVTVQCGDAPLGTVPPRTDTIDALSAEDVATLADFLVANVVGKSGQPTRADCTLFYGRPDHPACSSLR
jgi:hypothetical protein